MLAPLLISKDDPYLRERWRRRQSEAARDNDRWQPEGTASSALPGSTIAAEPLFGARAPSALLGRAAQFQDHVQNLRQDETVRRLD